MGEGDPEICGICKENWADYTFNANYTLSKIKGYGDLSLKDTIKKIPICSACKDPLLATFEPVFEKLHQDQKEKDDEFQKKLE